KFVGAEVAATANVVMTSAPASARTIVNEVVDKRPRILRPPFLDAASDMIFPQSTRRRNRIHQLRQTRQLNTFSGSTRSQPHARGWWVSKAEPLGWASVLGRREDGLCSPHENLQPEQ